MGILKPTGYFFISQKNAIKRQNDTNLLINGVILSAILVKNSIGEVNLVTEVILSRSW